MNAEAESKDAQSHAGAKVEGRMKNAEGLCKAISSHPHATPKPPRGEGRMQNDECRNGAETARMRSPGSGQRTGGFERGNLPVV